MIDEGGWEHGVKIYDNRVAQNKKGEEVPDDKFYVHFSLQMIELTTCRHLSTCAPCHQPLSSIASITQTPLTDIDATVNHEFV